MPELCAAIVTQSLSHLFSTEAFAKVWEGAPAEERARCECDEKLLQVANTARDARFRKAASQFGLCGASRVND
ncbi:MAG: hypothetical protein WBB42_04040 [Polyangiales bacterium]